MSKIKLWCVGCAVLVAMSIAFSGCGNNGSNMSSNPSSSDSISDESGTSGSDSDMTAPDDSQSSATGNALGDMVDKIYNDWMDGQDNWLGTLSEEDMATAYDMDFSNIEAYYGRVPQTNVHASSIIAVKAKPGKAEQAKAELMKYEAAVEKSFEKYLPEQYDMVKDYRIVESGDYLALIIADNADDVESAFEEAFKNVK